ncbi:MAG: hypothetical protein ISN29_08770 [Gammaproteobacteria bacterium AqS3]|nr:hypothetical protein [Gammaproteobacteria bacterium AqS3]
MSRDLLQHLADRVSKLDARLWGLVAVIVLSEVGGEIFTYLTRPEFPPVQAVQAVQVLLASVQPIIIQIPAEFVVSPSQRQTTEISESLASDQSPTSQPQAEKP